MSDERNLFDKFALCMEQNIRGVQYGVYSVALIGLAVALRSVRPFKKFARPQDIPVSFVEKHITLRGRVVGLEPSLGSTPALLQVDHYPVVSLSWLRPQTPHLPVHVSSIDVAANGVSWLQHIVVGSDIKFTVLKQNPSFVSCIVTKELLKPVRTGGWGFKRWIRSQSKSNLGLELVSLGFATVSPLDFSLEQDPLYIKYYKKLLEAEDKAEKKGTGMWATKRSVPNRMWSKVVPRISNAALGLLKELRDKPRKSSMVVGS